MPKEENDVVLKCEKLTNEIKQELCNISNELNVDMNTLYLVFEAEIEKLKADIKKEYNSTN